MPRVRMVTGLIGEDGTDWLPGETHEASVAFARYLVHREAATLETELPSVPLTTKSFDAPDPVAAHRDPIGPKKKR